MERRWTQKLHCSPYIHSPSCQQARGQDWFVDVCAGHPESHFKEITKATKGNFKRCSGKLVAFTDDYCPVSLNGEMYDSTTRTTKDEQLVSGVRCEVCKEYWSTLRSICHHHNTQGSTSSSEVPSHTNYRYLKTPEWKEHTNNLKAELDHSKQEIDRLKAKIKTHENEGVCIDAKLE